MATPVSSSLAAPLNFSIERGDNFARIFSFFTDTAQTLPLNVSTYDFVFRVTRKGNGAVVYEATSGAEITPHLTDTNKIEMDIPGADTELWEQCEYNCELQYTRLDGFVKTPIKGTLIVK